MTYCKCTTQRDNGKTSNKIKSEINIPATSFLSSNKVSQYPHKTKALQSQEKRDKNKEIKITLEDNLSINNGHWSNKTFFANVMKLACLTAKTASLNLFPKL